MVLEDGKRYDLIANKNAQTSYFLGLPHLEIDNILNESKVDKEKFIIVDNLDEIN